MALEGGEINPEQLDKALWEGQERFRHAFEYAAFGMALLSVDGRFLQVNQSLCRMFGYSPEELLHRSFQELTHPDDLEVGLDLLQDMLAGKRDHGWLEKRYIHREGREIWTLLSTSLVRDPQGAPQYLVSQIQDITERKQAETALQESVERYRSLFENSIDGILLTAPDGTILAANPAACRMFQRTEEEICQSGRSGLVDVSDPRLAVALEERARSGEYTSELFLLRKDGTHFPAEISSGLFKDSDSHFRTSMIIRDITERRQTEETLVKLSSAIEQTADIVFITNRDGVIEYVNPSFEKVTGYTRQEVIGQTPRFLKSGIHNEEFYERLWDVILSGGVFRAEITNRKTSGELFLEEKTITPIRDQKGSITHFVSTGKDVTARKQAEEALRASVERAQLIMDVTTDAVYDWDLATDIVQWNHGLRTLFGYTDEDLRDHNWWKDRVHPDDVDPIEASIQAALANGERFWTGEYRYLRADGSFAHVVDRGYVIRDDSQMPVRMIGAMVDITDRVLLAEAQTQAAMEERQRLARELHDSITQSLYSLTLLAEAGRRFAGQGDLRQAQHHLRRLGETAQQALKEMRLLVYELRPLVLQKVGLAGALRQRLDAVERRAGVQTRLEMEDSLALPPLLEEELYRLAQEALNNSLKHSGSPSVVVRLLSDGEYVQLEVEDKGIGVDLSTAGEQGGMGLTSMRERAERLGADLCIDSAIGGGTSIRVRVKIPCDSPGNVSPSEVTL